MESKGFVISEISYIKTKYLDLQYPKDLIVFVSMGLRRVLGSGILVA